MPILSIRGQRCLGRTGRRRTVLRVELLPYLNQKELYAKYRLDEPWDSPANKRVLEDMPDVFRSPYDDPKSTHAGYYVLVGPGTLFEPGMTLRMNDVLARLSSCARDPGSPAQRSVDKAGGFPVRPGEISARSEPVSRGARRLSHSGRRTAHAGEGVASRKS